MKGYRALRRPGAFALLGNLATSRIAGAAFPIVFVVTVAHTRGYPTAAVLQALMVISFAASAPLRARVFDRLGSARVLIPQTIVYMAALGGVTALTLDPAVNAVAIGAAALLAGVSAPALDPAVRTSWRPTAQDEDEVKMLHVFDSILEETGFLIGPVLASVLMLTAGLSWSLAVVAIVICVNNTLILLTPGVRRNLRTDPVPAESDAATGATTDGPGRLRRAVHTVLGPIARADLREIITPVVVIGVTFGLLAISIPSMAAAYGHIAYTGFITASISLGGVAGGLIYGASKIQSTLWRKQAALSLFFGVPALSLVFVRSPLIVAAALVASGLSVTPLYINSYLLIDEGIPATVKHEANSWVAVGNDLGYTIGITIGGFLIGTGNYGPPLIVASCVAALLVLVALRGLLRAPARASGAVDGTVIDETVADKGSVDEGAVA